MKNVTLLSLLTLFLFLTTAVTTTKAQNRPGSGSVGLSASFQGNQTNLLVPIWTTDDLVVAPLIGIVSEENSFTSLNIGAKARFYRDMGNNFASYLGFQGVMQHTSPEIGDDATDLVIGANGGGEYFLDDHFSLGVEGQLNFLLRDNNDNRLATGAALTGTYYF